MWAKRLLVKALEAACPCWLPFWHRRCLRVVRWSSELDERWETGVWTPYDPDVNENPFPYFSIWRRSNDSSS